MKATSEEIKTTESTSKITFKELAQSIYKSKKFGTRIKNYERDVRDIQIDTIKQLLYVTKKLKPFTIDRPSPSLKTLFRIKVFTKNHYLVELYLEGLHVDSPIKIRCSCPDFKYRFWYVLWKYNASFGKIPTKVQSAPTKTNPKQELAMCKHCVGVMQDLVDTQIVLVKKEDDETREKTQEALTRLAEILNRNQK